MSAKSELSIRIGYYSNCANERGPLAKALVAYLQRVLNLTMYATPRDKQALINEATRLRKDVCKEKDMLNDIESSLTLLTT